MMVLFAFVNLRHLENDGINFGKLSKFIGVGKDFTSNQYFRFLRGTCLRLRVRHRSKNNASNAPSLPKHGSGACRMAIRVRFKLITKWD